MCIYFKNIYTFFVILFASIRNRHIFTLVIITKTNIMNKQEQTIEIIKTNSDHSNILDEKVWKYRFVMFIDSKTNKTRLVMFRGKSSKLFTNTSFKDDQIQAKVVTEYETMAKEEIKKEEEVRAKQKAMKVTDNYKVGAVLYDSWGYSVTFCDYYQIIGFKGNKTAIIRPISKKTVSGDGFSGTVEPRLNAFNSETHFEVRLNKWGSLSGKVDDRSTSLSKWNGTPNYYNTLD